MTKQAGAPPGEGEKAEFELRSHFAGRRDGQRIRVALPVELFCVERNLLARTIDISVSGCLLELVDETERGMAELIEYCTEIGRLFAAGGTLDFECGVSRTVEAVRVTAGGLGQTPAPVMACRFRERLSAEDFVQIGLEPPSDEDVAGGTADDPDRQVEIFPESLSDKVERKVPAIHEIMRWAVELQATDIHVKAGSPPRLRVDGALQPVGTERLSDEDARAMVRNFLSEEQWAEFERVGDIDLGVALEGVGRFRINVMSTRKRVCMVLRRIPEQVPELGDLNLAPVCLDLAKKRRGLVLVTGGSGSGKSTTLAAMLRHINATRACHIVTLEDPIEFVHEEMEAQITQREIGADTENFASALRRVLRQDPDVIMIGELRDLETIRLAVTAAETGHLVYATLHTTSSSQTVDRIVDVFPAEQQRQIRVQLSSTLQGIVCQTLVPKLGGGVTVAQEVLVMTDAVRALIRDGKSPQLQNAMQTGASDGMQTLEDGLNALVADETIAYDTAVDYANAPGRIRELVQPTSQALDEAIVAEDEEPVEAEPRAQSRKRWPVPRRST